MDLKKEADDFVSESSIQSLIPIRFLQMQASNKVSQYHTRIQVRLSFYVADKSAEDAGSHLTHYIIMVGIFPPWERL